MIRVQVLNHDTQKTSCPYKGVLWPGHGDGPVRSNGRRGVVASSVVVGRVRGGVQASHGRRVAVEFGRTCDLCGRAACGGCTAWESFALAQGAGRDSEGREAREQRRRRLPPPEDEYMQPTPIFYDAYSSIFYFG